MLMIGSARWCSPSSFSWLASVQRLRGADSVSAPEVLRPLGIAEIKRSVGEVEALQCIPIRIRQVRGGFHHVEGVEEGVGKGRSKLLTQKAAGPGLSISNFHSRTTSFANAFSSLL